MTRCLVARAGLFVGLALVLAAGDAWAHGGNFRVPGRGGVVGGPEGASPPTVGPPVTVFTPPSRGLALGTPRRMPNWQPANWQVWWQLHRDAYLPGRSEEAAGSVETISAGVFQVGRAFVGHVAGPSDCATERGARDLALPYLMRLIDPRTKAPEPMVATALIAVGRIARPPVPLTVIQSWAMDRWASLEVRESAVLALGLLRRSDPCRQLPASVLSRLRDFLLRIFDDRKCSTRVRAFAMFSLALLADQPYGASAIEADGRLITRSLWTRLEKQYPSRELTVALLTALGHQPPRGVPAAVREHLRWIVRGRAVWRRKWDTVERSHALTALARLGGPESLPTLLHTLQIRREDNAVQAAALIGLAHQAERLTAEDRVYAAKTIHRLTIRDRHWFVRGLAHIALGSILAADLADGSHEVLRRTHVADFLERQARKGTSITRPYSAIALGISASRVPRHSRPIARHLRRVQDTMTWGLRRGRGADEVLGAYAVGAGLSRAEQARPLLLEMLTDRNRAPSLRGHAALALGHLGRKSEEVVEALRAGTRERISPFVHLQSVRALSLLGAEGTRETLLEQLQGQRPSRPALAAVASALGRIRDPRAARTIVGLAQNQKASQYVRVAAVMALGLSFDPESCPSRARLTTHANYPSITWSLAQVFNIM